MMGCDARSSRLALGLFLIWGNLTQAAPIFGPKEFRRQPGAPDETVETFDLRLTASKFKLIVKNGLPDGSHRTSSAIVTLNGAQIIGPNTLNQHISQVERIVAL